MDDDEFEAFVAARSPSLLRSATLMLGGDRATAEDVLQATLIKVFRRWHRVRSLETAEAYVRRAVINTVLNARRTDARRTARLAQLASYTQRTASAPACLDDGVADRLDLWAALAQLSPRQRVVLVLRYYEDMSEAAIAEAIGCSPGAVKSHAHRALSAMRTVLDAADVAESGREGARDGH